MIEVKLRKHVVVRGPLDELLCQKLVLDLLDSELSSDVLRMEQEFIELGPFLQCFLMKIQELNILLGDECSR